MTTEAIDAAATEPVETNNAQETEANLELSEAEAEEKQGEDSEQPWPEKATKAHAEQKRRAIRYKMEAKQYREQVAQLERKLSEFQKPASAPSIEDYADKSYEDYIRDLTKHEISQKLNEGEQAKLQSQQAHLEQEWINKRVVEVNSIEKDFASNVSDYQQVYQEAVPIISQFSPALENLVLSLENPVAALYHLQKEDRLIDLLDMPIQQAAVLLGRAEAKGVTAKKIVTTAPAPIRAVKGSGSANQSLSRLADDPKKLMEWYKKR